MNTKILTDFVSAASSKNVFEKDFPVAAAGLTATAPEPAKPSIFRTLESKSELNR